MRYPWERIDLGFLKNVVLSSEKRSEYKDWIDEVTDDPFMMASVMNEICIEPDRKFVMQYRTLIEQELLRYYPEEVRKICKALNIAGVNHNVRQSNLAKRATSASLINAYIQALWRISGKDVPLNEYSKFKYTISLNMEETEIEDVPLYDFQKEAVAKLKEHFVDQDKHSGILVMPTGSGKSRTATTFLIEEMISQGYQVLWIAHRHMLIDQAADCFYRFAGLSKIKNPKIKNYRISCISGEHLSCSQAINSEVVVASIASICRNKAHLKRILGKKVVIVVDEAHHTFAPTYREVISFVGKARKNTKLLGLTATPVRANEKDSMTLLNLYGNTVVYSASMSDLIAKGILADPKFIRIDTGENFEPYISLEEAKLIQRFKELPETVISKIASSYARNQVIVKEYLKHKDEYGKTLIFALNVTHCKFLYEELVDAGVKCGIVYSGKKDNSKVIKAFKENEYDVLVNVNVMTEGTDVPDIKTVFLTRPTQSEGLLMQMIGRGMRGLKAKGTEIANIVDFHDKWEVFNKWLNPEWLIGCEREVTPEQPERIYKQYDEYDWKLCQEVYKACVMEAGKYGKQVSIPVAWYTLIDYDGELTRMLVFEDQMQGIIAMMKDKDYWINDKGAKAEDALKKYFSYFCNRPSVKDLNLLMDNFRENEFPPQRNLMANRKSIEPYYVAELAEKTEKDIFAVASEIYDNNSIAYDLYESKENYIMAVCKAKIYKNQSVVLGLKVEELPVELIPFDRTPCYDLEELVNEVKQQMFEGVYDGIGSVEWTDKPYRGYYGVYYHRDNSIRINQVLNSNDVPREVVKYIIYHEMLHRDYRHHSKEFREKEHLYPNYEEYDYFLDAKMAMFDIHEW